MNERPSDPSSTQRFVPSLRLLLTGAWCVILGLGLVLSIATQIQWTQGNLDADMAPDRAQAELTRCLQGFGVTLEPATILSLKAHETHNGTQGGGDRWFLAQLKPEAAAPFEAHFLATIRARSKPLALIPFGDRVTNWHALRGLGTAASLPPGARVWWLNDQRDTCIVFGNEQFYLYLDEF